MYIHTNREQSGEVIITTDTRTKETAVQHAVSNSVTSTLPLNHASPQDPLYNYATAATSPVRYNCS